MSPPSVQDLTVNLLFRVNRLLAEAEEVRTIRDQLIATARNVSPAAVATPTTGREGRGHGR